MPLQHPRYVQTSHTRLNVVTAQSHKPHWRDLIVLVQQVQLKGYAPQKAVLTGLTAPVPDMQPVQQDCPVVLPAAATSAYPPKPPLGAHPLAQPNLDRYQDQSPQVHLM